MKKFGLIGAAGYIAPRHMKAIKETGNTLEACLDPNDSVGIIDSYFPNSSFFTEVERFDRHIDKLRRMGEGLDYMSICSPNYLHDSHARLGLRNGCDVICEKPLVLNPKNIDYLRSIEQESGKKINNILQLRLHEAIIGMKNSIDKDKKQDKYEIDLTYITSRGKWYHYSWKGQEEKSGGIITNIGVHFFDMLMWLFGTVEKSDVYVRKQDVASGYLELEKARIRWFLSCSKDYLPQEAIVSGSRTFRSLSFDNEFFEFSNGFTELHTKSYHHILSGKGFSIEEVRPSIEVVSDLRNKKLKRINSNSHSFLRNL